MLKIRLRRPGKSIKGRAHQKIVVTERSWARESRFIDQVGYYDPGRDLLNIDIDKYKEWLQKGARPSETVASLFKNYGKPKKVKKGKSFRPGERQDYPKSTKPDTEEQKKEAATTEAQKDTETPKSVEKEKKSATEGSPDPSVGEQNQQQEKNEKLEAGKKEEPKEEDKSS